MSKKPDNRVLSRQLAARDLSPQELETITGPLFHQSAQRRNHHVLHACFRWR